MALLDHHSLIDDVWVSVPDDAPLHLTARCIIGFDRASALNDLEAHTGNLGVVLPNAANVHHLAPLLPYLGLVALVFPGYRDGRAYSQATTLRRELGFCGEIRAIGAVLPDQVHFMARCGFETFEIADAAKAPVYLAALKRHRALYQTAADARTTVAELRSAQAHTASGEALPQ